MNFIQECFLEKLKNASEDIVMMSRKNCHQLHLDSVVIDRKVDGRLTRAFFAHEGHSMYLNDNLNQMSLGVHNHQYSIHLTKLSGYAVNVLCEDDSEAKEESHYITKYKYNSMLGGGSGVHPLHTKVHGLRVVCGDPITFNFLHHSDLHTVWVQEGCKASWIVEEGHKVKDETVLYSPYGPSRINNIGNRYQKFESKEEVVDMVERFLLE